ncbi:hypothetical protein RSOLAG22IIIB_01583 [Rhizoctonia solani]|uniref:CTLH/CRA C-terminal to LisH motif domain-containing protein n=1 Tax=Rhizoctonia solani TaxID=456999 RepID=A0A0K6G9C9_9AGAM|nr:hypothetical protein RSOLAG22IIIB_01583 [Rhizoctonia solani]
MSLTQAGGTLPSASDRELRGLVLSYLLYHGHKDTARVFAGEIARREDAESIERCPLWLPQDYLGAFSVNNGLKLPDHGVVSALDHASLPERDSDDQASNTTKPARPKEDITSRMDLNSVSESVLVDVEVRRKIRQTILSGRIDDAIELITHHLPTFLPINTPASGTRSADSRAQNGSHELSAPTDTDFPTRQATPPSPSPTPPSAPAKADTTTEKPPQKSDTPASTTLETNSPTPEDPKHAHTPTQAPRNPKSLSLGRSVNPAHILFNLRVQQFVEAIRTVPLPPSSKERDEASLTESAKVEEVGGTKTISPDPVDHNEYSTSSSTKHPSEARQRRLFQLASGLYQSIKSLACPADREIYAKEVEQVCSLMLGPSPESSLAAPYLSMSRREAVADQVNSAMLWYVGEAPAPRLQIWAQTAKVIWDQIGATRPTIPRTDDIPAGVRMYAKYVIRSIESEDQTHENTAIPFDFHSLARA